MSDRTNAALFDTHHLWHPYSALGALPEPQMVASARGVRIQLEDGRELIDGMASWWSVIHGYNHPEMNKALHGQIDTVSHVMFGGLTHRSAVDLAELLVEITPDGLETVFFADSGSVSVEVALKMAIQYWRGQGLEGKQKFVAVRNGYHGDTFGAMSVCDPQGSMHSLYSDILPQHYFADAPTPGFAETFDQQHIASLQALLQEHHQNIAALIIEPIAQGAGGMRFYSPDYLRAAKALCEQYQVLLIADEIATGFGRTGKLFACEHAGITPDIMCVGKALTGGYMTLAAAMTTREVAEGICTGSPGHVMHGPTFMANPLACTAALASVRLLLKSSWQDSVARLERTLSKDLASLADHPMVADVRVLGGIGVVELLHPVDMPSVQPAFVDEGVWIRPFGKLVYMMPAYTISDEELAFLCRAIANIIDRLQGPNENGAVYV